VTGQKRQLGGRIKKIFWRRREARTTFKCDKSKKRRFGTQAVSKKGEQTEEGMKKTLEFPKKKSGDTHLPQTTRGHWERGGGEKGGSEVVGGKCILKSLLYSLAKGTLRERNGTVEKA